MPLTTEQRNAASAPFLTLDNAKVWSDKRDKFVWVINNVLDHAEVRGTDRNVQYVEDEFERILTDAGLVPNYDA